MSRRKKIAVVLGILLLFAITPLAFILLSSPSAPRRSFPNPNGYETLAKAGKTLTRLPLDYDTTTDLTVLGSYLSENEDAMELINQSASQEFLVRCDDFDDMEQALEHGNYLRGPVRLLRVQARLAELEGRFADAADAYTRMFVLSERADDGGLLVHALVSLACKDIAIKSLGELSQQLTPDVKLAVADKLEKNQAGSLDIDEVLVQEREMVRRDMGLITGTLMLWRMNPPTTAIEQVRAKDAAVGEQLKELVESLRRPDDSETGK